MIISHLCVSKNREWWYGVRTILEEEEKIDMNRITFFNQNQNQDLDPGDTLKSSPLLMQMTPQPSLSLSVFISIQHDQCPLFFPKMRPHIDTALLDTLSRCHSCPVSLYNECLTELQLPPRPAICRHKLTKSIWGQFPKVKIVVWVLCHAPTMPPGELRLLRHRLD